ncbi:MAG: hypothetical protein JST22_21120 [Bacteroidetes bacterium]|nr:hypothetical protein [Bacteroidota bacterium]
MTSIHDIIRTLPIAAAITMLLTAFGAKELRAQQNWAEVQAAGSKLQGICFATATNAYAVGENGAIVASTDGGTTWTALNSGVINNLWTVRFSSATMGVAAGDSGTVLTTADGGITWTRRNSGLQRGAFDSFVFGLYTRDGRTWYAAGGDGQAGAGVILRSADGGITWGKTPITGSFFMDRCDFADEATGFAVGLSATGGGLIMRTTDGGTTWKPNHASSALVAGLHVVDAATVVAVGSNGMFYRTTDGGTTWSESSPGSSNLVDVEFMDAMNGIATGDNGTVIATNDGGAHWHDLSPGNTQLLSDAAIAPGSGTVLVTGDHGSIFRHASIAASVEQSAIAAQVFLAPNPMTTSATLRTSAAARITFFDMMGRTVLSRETAAGGLLTLDRTVLTAGRYLYVVVPEQGGVMHGTLVVQ